MRERKGDTIGNSECHADNDENCANNDKCCANNDKCHDDNDECCVNDATLLIVYSRDIKKHPVGISKDPYHIYVYVNRIIELFNDSHGLEAKRKNIAKDIKERGIVIAPKDDRLTVNLQRAIRYLPCVPLIMGVGFLTAVIVGFAYGIFDPIDLVLLGFEGVFCIGLAFAGCFLMAEQQGRHGNLYQHRCDIYKIQDELCNALINKVNNKDNERVNDNISRDVNCFSPIKSIFSGNARRPEATIEPEIEIVSSKEPEAQVVNSYRISQV